MTRRRLLAFVVDWMGPKCSVASAEPSPGSDRMRAAVRGRSAGGRLKGDCLWVCTQTCISHLTVCTQCDVSWKPGPVGPEALLVTIVLR